jgi:ketosteroid isomerase-like protein
LAPRFEHIFAGTHALGGERHTAAAMRRWFEPLFRLLPNLAFKIKHIAVSGSPWDTTIVVEWRDTAPLPGGRPYVNDGVHVMRMLPTRSLRGQFVVVAVDLGVDPAGHRQAGASERAPQRDLGGAGFPGDETFRVDLYSLFEVLAPFPGEWAVLLLVA